MQVRAGFTQFGMFDIVEMRLRHADAILICVQAGNYIATGITPAAAFCLWPVW